MLEKSTAKGNTMKANKPPISRSQVADPLLSIANRVAAAGIAPVSMEEINDEGRRRAPSGKRRVPWQRWTT